MSPILVCVLLLAPFVAGAQPADQRYATAPVSFLSGALRIRAVLGRPEGSGPFPAYISNHGAMTVQEAARGPWSSIVKGSLPGYAVFVPDAVRFLHAHFKR